MLSGHGGHGGLGRAERIRWAAARGLLGTVGRASEGVRLGHRHGFGSGTLLDHVYADRARGVLGVGRALDRAFLDAVGWRAARARCELLGRMLREEIAGRGGEIVVLDVASGPGRYLQDLVAEEQPGGQLRVVCRDLAPAALARGRRLARERGLPRGALTYEQGDALDPAPLADGLRPDLVVVSGLYELIPDDEVVRASLERLREMLAPGGTLLFTTQTRNPPPGLLARMLPDREGTPWRTRCRPVGEAEIRAVKAGFAQEAVSSRREDVGLFTVTRCATA
ncbi:class I SAM-dependent methyltransferase family protein [Streptomyces sp. NPDC048172]|uniref:class I SAM-dependent methyltransferase family protein n=1 Tax=Streptomyces sp. NPDC048172 TaxID=3365505 RepID=UPI003721D096